MNFKKLILIFLFLGALTGALTTTFLYSKLVKTKSDQNLQEKSKLLSSSPDADNLTNQDSINILLLGYGGAGHDGAYLTDSIIVANINYKKQKVNLISIPRDLWMELPVDWDFSRNNKINEAYAIGGNDTKYANKKPKFRGEKGRGEMAKYAAEVVLGIPINNFIAVDFSGFEKIIDLLGGIEVEAGIAFDDYFYPVKGKENLTCGKSSEEIAQLHKKYSGFNLEKQFECRYEHLHFDKGKQVINGESALKYVRSRHSDQSGGDFARSKRQLEVLKAIENKLISLSIIEKASPIFDQLYESVKTDIETPLIKTVLNRIGDYKLYSINQINITEENALVQSTGAQGQFILIPKEGVNKWDGVHKYILSQL